MITKTRVALLLSLLLILSGCGLKKNESDIVLQIAASDVVKAESKLSSSTQYTQVYETKEEPILGTKLNNVIYRQPSNSNGISWMAAKVQDAQDARQEVQLIHTYNQFNEKIATITVPGSKKIIDAQPTIYEYGANVAPGVIYFPYRVTRYGYDCGGCTVRPDGDFSGTASGIKVGADRVLQSNGEWKQGLTYDGYYIVATSSAIPMFSILKISNHPFSGGGIVAGQPFYAIVANRGVGGSNLDLFAGTEKNLGVISQSGSPSGSNTKVEIVRVGR